MSEYNPGFFGWMWDGITNPTRAWNTFENNHLVNAGERLNNFLAPVTDPIKNFLQTNPVGQGIAPLLQQGVGVEIRPGSNPTAPNAPGGPTFTPHLGMAAPTGPMDTPDYNAIVDAALKDEIARQPALAAPAWQPPRFSYKGKEMTEAEYRKATTGGTLGASTPTGWDAATQAAQRKGASRLSDGTEYKTSVVNGQTVYTIVNSPKRPDAVGKQLDDRNFDNLLSGKSYTPVAAAPSPAAGAPTSSNLQTSTIDPALVAGASGVIGAGSSLVAGQTQSNAEAEAARIQAEAMNKATTLQETQFNTAQANLAPWKAAGERALHNLEHFEQFDPAWSMDKFQQDPGYAFRLSEGMKALQNSAAARGGLLSGNTMKGISDYGQQSASQEYQSAFNRYQTERGQRLNNLQSLAGVGQTAVQQANSAGQSYANNAGNMMIGGANALAQGGRNAADANASGYMGAGNALINALGTYSNQKQSQNFLNTIYGGK